jgi:uncharacterized membrane-anchored protein YhcB (DUF1043 family)
MYVPEWLFSLIGIIIATIIAATIGRLREAIEEAKRERAWREKLQQQMEHKEEFWQHEREEIRQRYERALEKLQQQFERKEEFWQHERDEIRQWHERELRDAVAHERGWWTLLEKIRERQENELRESSVESPSVPKPRVISR